MIEYIFGLVCVAEAAKKYPVVDTPVDEITSAPLATNKPRKNRRTKNTNPSPTSIQDVATGFLVTLQQSAIRLKTAINSDQKYLRWERNRTRRTVIFEKNDHGTRLTSHRSAGFHGGKPRYKDHRFDSLGKAGEFRARAKRPTQSQFL